MAMTDTEKQALLKTITGEADNTILSAYLSFAASAVLRRRYPFGDGTETFPEMYENDQIKIAAYLLNKRGAEGETSHNENGINRSYESADVPESLLKGITPVGRTIPKVTTT